MIDTHQTYRALTLVVTALAVAACDPQMNQATVDPDRTTPVATQQEVPGTESSSDISAMTARARVSDLRIGTEVGPDGAVSEHNDQVVAGEAIVASIAVGDVGVGSQMKAVWSTDDDRQLSEQTAVVEPGQTHIVFRAPDTIDWAVGDYELEIFLGDEVAASESFEVVDRAG